MMKLMGFLVLCSSGWLLGQNYLTNGEFTQNLDDWDTSGLVTHSTESYGSPGSARFPFVFNSQTSGIQQCGQILDSLDYKFSAWIKSSGNVSMTLAFQFYESTNCTTEIGAKTLVNSYVIPNTDWVYYSFSLGSIPVGSLGVKMNLTFQNQKAATNEILVSSVFLGRFHHASGQRNIATVVKSGDTLPNTNGLPVVAINSPRTSPGGDLIFGGLTGNGGPSEYFLWVGDGVVLTPTMEPAFSRINGGFIALDNQGNWVGATIEGNSDILWSSEGELLREGDSFPLLPDYEIDFFYGVQANGNGNFSFNMLLSSMRKNGGSIGAIVQVNDIANPVYSVLYASGGKVDGEPIACTNSGVTNFSISADGQHHVASLLVENKGAVLAKDGEITLRENQSNNIQREWRFFSRSAINNNGDYISSGSLVADTNLRVYNSGSFTFHWERYIQANGQAFLRPNQKWAGIRLQEPCSSPNVRINNRGEAVVFWLCQDEGYWFYIRDISAPAATAVLILKSGDILDIDGDTFPESTVDVKEGSSALYDGFSIDDQGQITITTAFGSFSPYPSAMVTFESPCTPGADFYENLPTWPNQTILSFLPLDCEDP